MPIAINTTQANEQHYEVPAAFFDLYLGKWKKYSACLYKNKELYCKEAGIEDGMTLLDLGCGWGSLTLFLATQYPKSQVTGVSNSKTQKAYIESVADRNGLSNIEIITADINSFEAPKTYDRILSIEMFEHMKNYKLLLKRMAEWLKPEGKVFVHYFCHKKALYEFEVEGEDDWMAKHFFTGGTMPSLDLLNHFQEDLVVTKCSYLNGVTYSRTLEAWLERMDNKRSEIMPLFEATYGKDSQKWFVYWRLFYMACSELFRYDHGEEWGIAHVVLEKPTSKHN